jgi:predicted aldo/keto reductase-like oxidoreductase
MGDPFPATLLQICSEQSHVHLVLTGPKNREQLQQNLQAIQQGPLNLEELN